MSLLRTQRRPGWSALGVTRLALVAISLGCALAAGCGGSKSTTSNAGTTAGGSSDAAAAPAAGAPSATPALRESSVTPPGPAVGAGEPGAVVFAKRCALCHGADGHGDGVASKGLNPKPRNFHDLAYMQTRTDAQLLDVIHKGKGVMPRWEGQLSEADMKAVLAYIRTLGSKP